MKLISLYNQPKYTHKIKTSKYQESLVSTIFTDELIKKYYKRYNQECGMNIRKVIKSLIVNFITYKFNNLAISMSNREINSYKSDWYTYRTVKKVMEILTKEGYIKMISKGHWNKKYDKGFIGVYEATNKLKSNCICKEEDFEIEDDDGIILKVNDVKVCLEMIKVKELYNKINNKRYNKINNKINNISLKKLLHYAHVKKLIKIRDAVTRQNKSYFSAIKLSFPGYNDKIITNVCLKRSFGIYDGKLGGGRYFQTGGTSYINLECKFRQDMLINNKEIIECDYSGMFISILYNQLGIYSPYKDNYIAIIKQLNGDIKDKRLRQIMKICVYSGINAKNYLSYSRSFNKKPWERSGKERISSKYTAYEQKQYLESKGFTIKDVYNATKIVHSKIERFFYTNTGVLLMLKESNIISNVIDRLIELDILAIPLHDCMICQKGNEEIVKKIMQDEYKKYTGYDIGVEKK